MQTVRRFVITSVLLAGIALLAACSPQSAAEKAFFDQREAEKEARDKLHKTLTDNSLKDRDLVNMVASNAAPDGSGLMEDWIKRQIGQQEGQVMFPRWRVLRKGDKHFEVQYLFNVINADNRLLKKGYRWDLDASVKVVGSPVSMEMADKAIVIEGPQVTPQRRRQAEAEASLE